MGKQNPKDTKLITPSLILSNFQNPPKERPFSIQDSENSSYDN